MRFHFGRNEFFSIRCLVNHFLLFNYPEMKLIADVVSLRLF